MKGSRSFVTILIAVLIIVIVPGILIAYADDGIPTLMPTESGGGSSGGGNSTSQNTLPEAVNIVNSNGIVIGNATAYEDNDIMAHAEWNVTADNETEWVYVDAKLNTMPASDMTMEIGMETPDRSLLPDFLHPDRMIVQVSFTDCSGWSVRDGSFKITVKVPASAIKGIGAQDSYYLLQSNGNEYELIKVNIAGPDAQGMMTYDATPSRVSLSASGPTSFMLLATPTTLAMPTPVATPTPTPEPDEPGISMFMLLVMVFIPALIAGMIIVYYEMLRKK